MRPNLRSGKLIEPEDFADGSARLLNVRREIEIINNQLLDPGRILNIFRGDVVAYDAWKQKAKCARSLFQKEERLLLGWLSGREPPMLRQFYDALKRCIADGVEFEPYELEAVKNGDMYFASVPREEKTA